MNNAALKDRTQVTSTSRVVTGVSWLGGSKLVQQTFRFGIGAVLARLLLPSDFGLVAMVLVFSGVIELFSQLGLGAALIQRKEITEEHLSSVFWVNIVMGLFLTLLMIGLAPAIAYFYGKKLLVPIASALGLQFLIASFSIVHQAILTRRFEFKKLAIIETIAMTTSGVVAIVLALNGFGVWSIVAQALLGSTFNGILLWSTSRWHPRWIFRWDRLKELFGFSFNLLGFSLINYCNRNLDNLLIGRFLSPAMLGYYSRAYQFMLYPLQNISGVLGRVLFPALSTIQGDLPKTRDVYLRATRYVSVFTFPMMLGLLVVAPELIQVVYGPQWNRAILLLQVLCVVGMQQSIETTVGWIYYSQGRTDIMFKWSLVEICMAVTAFAVGLRWNIEGVTIAYAVAASLWILPEYYIVLRLIKLPMTEFFQNFVRTFLMALGMGILVYVLRRYLKYSLQTSNPVTLFLCVTAGIVSYMGLMMLFGRQLIKELVSLLLQIRKPDKTPAESGKVGLQI